MSKRSLVVISIEEQACDGVVGDFTVILWDNARVEALTVHCSYFAKSHAVVLQQTGLDWDTIEFISSHEWLRSEFREIVLAERDALEEDATKLAGADATKVFDRKPVNPAFNVN